MSADVDPRLKAMAQEWCRMIGRDPDELVFGSRREARWTGYLGWCRQLLEAVERAEAEAPADA